MIKLSENYLVRKDNNIRKFKLTELKADNEIELHNDFNTTFEAMKYYVEEELNMDFKIVNLFTVNDMYFYQYGKKFYVMQRIEKYLFNELSEVAQCNAIVDYYNANKNSVDDLTIDSIKLDLQRYKTLFDSDGNVVE